MDFPSRINILVLGLDRRPEAAEGRPSRSDTMFVASIDTEAQRRQMLGDSGRPLG